MSKPIKKALVIDDEQIDQMLYKRVLKRSGLVEDAIGFQYAEKALDYLRENKPDDVDVIFLDINMPRMNGFEFLKQAEEELGQKFSDLFVVMLTTSLDPSDRNRAEEFGAVRDFINKPLTAEHVAQVAEMLH